MTLNSGTGQGGWKHIIELIKSLTPSEKGYFKKYTSGFAENKANTYLTLFQLLEREKDVNEKKIEKALAGKTKNIHSLRNFLYRQILKSLRAYHTEKNIQYRLREILDYAEILSDRGLNEQSRHFIDMGIELSDPVTLPAYQILFQTQHIQLLRYLNQAEKIQKTDEIVSSIASSIDIIKHSYVTRQGLTKALYYVNTYFPLRNKAIRKEVLQLLAELKKVPDTEQQNYRMRNTRNAAISLLYRLLNDWDNAILYQEKTIRIIETLDTRNLNRNIAVISAYYNYVSLFINKGDTKNYTRFINIMQALPVAGKAEERYLQATALQLQLDHMTFNKDFRNAAAIIKAAELLLTEHHPIPSIYLETLMRLTYYYICKHQFNAALEKINLLLHTNHDHTLKSFSVHVRLVNILIHYELGNTLVLPSLIRNTYRYMMKQDLKFRIENILLNFFRKLLNSKDEKHLTKIFTALSNQLQAASQDAYEKKALQYFFDYPEWISLKLSANTVQSFTKR